MAKASDKNAILQQNLVDCGFDSQTINTCIKLTESSNEAALLRTLSAQKESLLNEIHLNRKRIDCLDYLVYQIKRGNVI